MTDKPKTPEEAAVDIADASIQRIRGGMDIDHILHALYDSGYQRGREEAKQITFGKGLIRISKARKEEDRFESILIISDLDQPETIGAIDNCPYVGRSPATIPGERVELWFDNVAGLDALLASLNEIRAQMLEAK